MSTRLMLQRGFSLIELMIGMLIGLLCTLVIATVMSAAEGNRRGTTSGTDAQIAGGLALYGLQRDIASSGYGFASETNAVGCNLVAFFNSVAVPALPPRLAPVFITDGAGGAPDTIRTISSSKGVDPATGSITGFTVPVRAQSVGVVGAPGYVMGAQQYQVASALTYDQGDLVVAVPAPNAAGVVGNCELFEINAPVVSQVALPRQDEAARWNMPGHPAQTATPATAANVGAFLVNLGQLQDRIYSLDANQRLVLSTLNTNTLARTEQEIQGGIVQLQAFYGRDTTNSGGVDTYDNVTPTNSAEWQNVLSIRLALVARSGQYEKEEVTTANPLWDVGTAATVAGSQPCGPSNCVTLRVDLSGGDWKHYRYRVFDTVVPLRNQRFRSGS
jgi:type IV pilus assembly protein PilW